MKPLPLTTSIREASITYIKRCEAELRLVREALEQRPDLTTDQIMKGAWERSCRTPTWSHNSDENDVLKIAWRIIKREHVSREKAREEKRSGKRKRAA